MSAARQRTGRMAEDMVAMRLASAGWLIVERNARTRYGELDIVALEGPTLVFVEVKAGRAGAVLGPERPALAVDHQKQRRIRRLAAAWISEHPLPRRYTEMRFDVVGVTFDGTGRAVEVEHIRAAF